MRMLGTSLALVLLALPLFACGGKAADTPDAAEDCSMDPRADTFVVGLDKKGQAGALDFVLESSMPAAPSRGNNTWVVQINSMSAGVVGSPVSGLASDIVITSYMPDHGHYSVIPTKVTETATPGQYQLSPINLFMPGIWQTTIQASGGTADMAMFSYCVEN